MDDQDPPIDKWGWLSPDGRGTLRYPPNHRHLPTAPKRWRRVRSVVDAAAAAAASSGKGDDDGRGGPRGRCSHTTTEVSDRHLLLFGGGCALPPDPRGGNDGDGGGPTPPRFAHLSDLWRLDALTARWERLDPVVVAPRGDGSRRPCVECEPYRGMEFGPPRRGHCAAYYRRGDETGAGLLIIFGGITSAEEYDDYNARYGNDAPPPPRRPRQSQRFLNDVWVLDLGTLEWIRVPDVPASNSRQAAVRPEPRRGAVSWIHGDYFHVYGGEADDGAEEDGMANFLLRFMDPHGGGDDGDDRDYVDSDSDEDGSVVDGCADRRPRGQGLRSGVVHRLGPLSDSEVTHWSWSAKRTWNSAILQKRTPEWPVLTLPPRPFGSLAMSAHAMMTVGRARHLWVFGGLDWLIRGPGHHPASNLFYRLDLDTYEWVVISVPTNSPCPRYCHGMTVMGRFLLIAGGIGFIGIGDVFSDIAAEEDDGDDSASNGLGREEADETVGADASVEIESAGDMPAERNEAANEGALPSAATRLTGEHTIFDLYLFDTETMIWKRLPPSKIPGDWPSARNGLTLTRLGPNRAILFGGGVYPSTYLGDTYSLEVELPQKIPKFQGGVQGDASGLMSDLGSMYKTGLMADMTLKLGDTSLSGGREFRVHRCILASRCAYFRIMFSGGFAESSASEITLKDVGDADALEFVLQYLYTGSLSGSTLLFNINEDSVIAPGTLSSILQLCDRWGIATLASMIEDSLACVIRKDDTDPFEMIAFAKAHNCKRLKIQALDSARRKCDTLRLIDDCDPEIVDEIQDYINSLI